MKRYTRMNLPLVLVLALSAILMTGSLVSVTAQTFEGVVQFTATSERGTIPITYIIKGDHARVEFEGRPGQTMALLINGKENKTVMLMDQMKMFMEVPVPEMQQTDKAKPEMTKTGKTQKILGYNCEQVLVKEGDQEAEVWVTSELGKFQMFRMGGRQQQNNFEAWQKAFAGGAAFPLLVVSKKGESQVSKLEATKVEKKSVDDSLFKVPDGYQKFDAAMMGKPRQ